MKTELSTAKIYLVGGFLGCGKTTAIASACVQLIGQGRKVAVITNDQGDQQVDSEYFQNLSLPHAEVPNGCFCCNYADLEKKLLEFQHEIVPEFIFAESVGSCTDLVATIAKPLTRFHAGCKVVISVFADASLLELIINGKAVFTSESIRYIYMKQLEEADIIVLNKKDLLDPAQMDSLTKVLEESLPTKQFHWQDAYSPKDIGNWLDLLNGYNKMITKQSLDLDYDRYGAGEAALAWLDQRLSIHTVSPVALKAAWKLIRRIHFNINQAGFVIGHLKFMLSDDNGWNKKISFTAGGQKNEEVGEFPVHHLNILINARVEASPTELRSLIADAIQESILATGCRIIEEKPRAFQPGFPRPEHRIAD